LLLEWIDVPAGIGYPVLFLLVGAESAGALVPGETALIVAAALAADGRLALPFVVVIAALAAILGDNVGYLLGRNGLRRLLQRPGRGAGRRQLLIARGEAFFTRHGSAAVFFGRWLPGLRLVAAWLAGANRMPWRRFLVWNALGGILWAATVGGAAYLMGRVLSNWLGLLGLGGLALLAAAFALRLLSRRRSRLAPSSG
jgi:membrane protein DedA with SNARE-associated domain